MTFTSVLFLCVANSARSQMAHALAQRLFGDGVRVQSAGSEPTRVNPLAITVLQELNCDTQGLSSKHVNTIDPSSVDLVITLCAEESCPVFLGDAQRLSWAMPDPDRKDHNLTDEERLAFFRTARDQILARLEVLAALHEVPPSLAPTEFHTSIRVPNLAQAARFYSWMLGIAPKQWTHRYVVFVHPALSTNFVLLVSDGKTLHQDTLFHLGVEVANRAAIIDAHKKAEVLGCVIVKPARTTWRGTPLHELWLKDPGGNLIEIYARLTEEELQQMPADKNEWFIS